MDDTSPPRGNFFAGIANSRRVLVAAACLLAGGVAALGLPLLYAGGAMAVLLLSALLPVRPAQAPAGECRASRARCRHGCGRIPA